MKKQPEAGPQNPACSHLGCLGLAGIALLALGLRVAAFFSLKGSPYFDTMLWDERLIHALAVQIAEGSWRSASVYEIAPLPMYISALLYTVLSPDIVWVRWMNVGLGGMTPVVVALIGQRLGGRRVGLFSGLVAALYGPFLFYSVVPLKTALSVLLFALFLWTLLCAADGARLPVALASGLLLGLVVGVRPNMLVLFGAAGVAFGLPFLQKKRGALRSLALGLCFAAGFMMAVLPFMVRNKRVAGELTLTASQAGFNLYSSNNPGNPLPYYRPVPFASSSPFVQGIHYTIEASRRSGRTLSPQEASLYWRQEVIRYAAHQPGRFWGNMGRKALVFLHAFEAGDHYHMGFMARFVPFFSWPWPSYAWVAPLGLAGLLWAAFRHRHGPTLLVCYGLYGATLVLLYTNTRYRLPMMVVIIPMAVLFVGWLHAAVRSRNRSAVAGFLGCAGLVAGVGHLPLLGTDDMTAYWNTHAIVAAGAGQRDEAVRWWTRSAETSWPYAAYARLSLAGECLQRGEEAESLAHLSRIGVGDLAAAARFEMEGDIAVSHGRLEEAVRCYLRALSVNSGTLPVYRKLHGALSGLGRLEDAKMVGRKAGWVATFYR